MQFFTSKPSSFGTTKWTDYAGNKHKACYLSPGEIDNYYELLKLPEWMLLEVSIKVQIK